eukprot:365417-Chlamydomonas_euryale.AAC.22
MHTVSAQPSWTRTYTMTLACSSLRTDSAGLSFSDDACWPLQTPQAIHLQGHAPRVLGCQHNHSGPASCLALGGHTRCQSSHHPHAQQARRGDKAVDAAQPGCC